MVSDISRSLLKAYCYATTITVRLQYLTILKFFTLVGDHFARAPDLDNGWLMSRFLSFSLFRAIYLCIRCPSQEEIFRDFGKHTAVRTWRDCGSCNRQMVDVCFLHLELDIEHGLLWLLYLGECYSPNSDH